MADPLLSLKRKAWGLEKQFFIETDVILKKKLSEMKALEETKESLSKVSGITDGAVLQKLAELGIRPETLASLVLVPLVEIAWADGDVDVEERAAVLAAVEKWGWKKEGLDYELLKEWLVQRPRPELLEAWSHYMEALCGQLSDAEREKIRSELVAHAKAVAAASGGVLGIGAISREEKMVIERIEKPFCL